MAGIRSHGDFFGRIILLSQHFHAARILLKSNSALFMQDSLWFALEIEDDLADYRCFSTESSLTLAHPATATWMCEYSKLRRRKIGYARCSLPTIPLQYRESKNIYVCYIQQFVGIYPLRLCRETILFHARQATWMETVFSALPHPRNSQRPAAARPHRLAIPLLLPLATMESHSPLHLALYRKLRGATRTRVLMSKVQLFTPRQGQTIYSRFLSIPSTLERLHLQT